MSNIVHYHSFPELVKAMGQKERKKDKEKLDSQREKFGARHTCRGCGQPMTWIPGTNQMVCKNPECKGIKITKTDKETGETRVFYEVSHSTLDDLGTKIATDIFDERVC